MSQDSLITVLKELLPLALLGLAWAAYIIGGARWLRGVRRVRLF
jgi:hypothetical protein